MTVVASGSRARDAAHRLLLYRAHPRLAAAVARSARHEDFLRPRHEAYVREVSDAENAASVRLAALLWALCEHLRPRRLVDLGSGFTSYVLRAWVQVGGGEVWSVDDDPAWLARTEAYLTREGVSTENLAGWSDFAAEPRGQFDLVLHDLGRMTTRLATLPAALELARPGAPIVLDDIHKAPYYPSAKQELHRLGWPAFNLAWRTRDEFGRFAGIVFRPG